MKQTSLAVAIGLALSVPLHLQANPSGPQVVNGTATFSNPSANVLNVTNSNNAIINWQSFNIGQGQTTNFIQPSSASSVLNKVVGNNPSQILGNLNSNGKVFLINQHGILVGQGAQINTAGFFGSTLNLTNEDYLNGDLTFEGGGLGGIENQGYIHAGDNGHIVLIAPDIENGGVIEVDNGNVILAAGKSITITSLENSSIQFEVAGSEDSVTNLGQIIAKNGAASLFAGTLEHSGAIRATGLVRDADGTIRLVATDSNTVSGTLDVSGENGGHIEVLGDVVTLEAGAYVDASGDESAGEILIGGDQQGLNPDVMNATSTTVAEGAEVHADGNEEGDGGRVIVFAENDVHVHGEITAKGGEEAGDGGFIETSGLKWLDIATVPDAGASNGAAGEWLIDPNNITLVFGTGANITGNPDFTSTDDSAFLDVSLITAALNTSNVSVSTGSAGTNSQVGDIYIYADIAYTGTNDTSLTFNAHNDIVVSTQSTSALTVSSTSAVMDVIFNADSDADGSGGVLFDTGTGNSFPITIDTNGGQFVTNTDVDIIGDVINRSSNVTINADWTIPVLTSVYVDEDLVINTPSSTVITNNGEIFIGQSASLNTSGDTLDLLPGSILAGVGTLTGNVTINGGTIFGGFGGESSGGTLSISDNLTMNSGLLYTEVTAPDGLIPSFVTTGTADINGGSLMVVWGEDSAIRNAFDGVTIEVLNCTLTIGCLSGSGFDTIINPVSVTNGLSDIGVTTADVVTYEFDTVDSSTTFYSWSGNGDGISWADANNWIDLDLGGIGIPGATDYAYIQNGLGETQIILSALESVAGLQSFEEIRVASNGILRVNGDAFILDGESPNDGQLSFLAADARLEGTGVLYMGPGSGLGLVGGVLTKDIVNWGGVVTTAGSNFNLESNLVNSSIFIVGGLTGSSSVSGAAGSITHNGTMLFGDGANFDLLDNIILTSASANASYHGIGLLSLQNTSTFDVAVAPSVYDATIDLTLAGGTFANANNMPVLPDLIEWNSGTISGSTGTFNILAGQVMNLNGAGDMTFSGGMDLVNDGTINFLSSGGNFILSGTLQNNGLLALNQTGTNVDLAVLTSATLDNGTVGTVSYDSANDLNVAWDILNAGTFNVNNGRFLLAGAMDVTGSVLNVTNNAQFVVASGGQLTMNTSSDFSGDSSGFLVADFGGLIDLASSLTKDLGVFSELQLNGGVVDNVQNAILPATVSLSTSSALSGIGSLTIPAATTVTVQGGAVFAGQDSANLLTVDNLGTIDVLTGQTLTLSNAELINDSGSLTGGGQLILPTFGTLTASSGIDIAELYLVGGLLNANSLTYGGFLDWTFGTVADTDSGTGLATTGQVNLLSGTLTTDWTVDSTGDVFWTGTEFDELVIQNATISNFGDFTIESFAYDPDQLIVSDRSFSASTNATFENHSGGELVIDANDDIVDFTNVSYVDQGGVIGLESGTFTLGTSNDLVLDSGGSLQGFGTFAGNVNNLNGKVSPGATGVSIPDEIGTLTITGNLSQGAESTLEINIDSTGTDVMSIGGSLLADGAVDFGAINGASDAQVQQVVASGFDPVSYSAISGEFSTVTLRGNYGFDYSADGTLIVGVVPNPVGAEDRVIQQIESLLESNQLDYGEFVESMAGLGGDVFEVLFANEIGEDEDEKAPRLVCK